MAICSATYSGSISGEVVSHSIITVVAILYCTAGHRAVLYVINQTIGNIEILNCKHGHRREQV